MDYGELSYNDIIRRKRVSDLSKYFSLAKGSIDELIKFLADNPTGRIVCSTSIINLVVC